MDNTFKPGDRVEDIYLGRGMGSVERLSQSRNAVLVLFDDGAKGVRYPEQLVHATPAKPTEYIYRVVNRNGNPTSQAWPRRGMQNSYYDKASAKRVATRTNGRVQYSVADWRDLDD